jgi:hypothetical protein
MAQTRAPGKEKQIPFGDDKQREWGWMTNKRELSRNDTEGVFKSGGGLRRMRA